jgi:hypothetical protein
LAPAVAAPPRLGIVPEEVPAVLLAQLDLPKGEGVIITEVVPGTPAEKGGIKANDILLSLGGKVVPAEDALRTKMIAALPAGTTEAVVLRKGKKETLKLTLAEPTKPRKLVMREVVVGGPKFSSMSVKANNDDFGIAATNDAATYDIVGVGGAVKSITITPKGEKAQKYESIDDVPSEHKPAVVKLLGSVGK